jgi:signal transduction histidine kinase/CheY-like chemotaxis protein
MSGRRNDADRSRGAKSRPASVQNRFPDLARRLVEAAFPGLVLHRAGRIIECTNAFEVLLGIEPGTGVGRALSDFLPSESESSDRSVAPGEPSLYETVALRADGTAVSLEVITISLDERPGGPDHDDEIRATAARDVSRRRRFEKSLRQSQKLEALGQLAAGMAHEINNPLTYVILQLDAIAEAFDRSDGEPGEEEGRRIHERVIEAIEGAERVRRLTREMRIAARTDDAEPDTAVDLALAVERAAKLAANEIRDRGRLIVDLAGVPAVIGSEGRLVQVVLNLLVNAAHALDGATDPREIRVCATSDENHVRLQVADTGRGIRRDILPRIFDPFFSTKAAGAGTGLGLAICRNIIQASGGSIEAESAPGKGTCFTITLRRAKTALSSPPSESPTNRPATPRLRILVVDDEESIRDAITGLLSDEHEIVTADNGDSALATLSNDAGFDLVLCDLMMPGCGGIELHGLLERDFPLLARRIIFMTGGATTSAASEFLDKSRLQRLSKPFRASALREAIQEAAAFTVGRPPAG